MLKKHIFAKKNTRQAPAGTAKSKKKDSKKEKIFDHQGKATFYDLIFKCRVVDDQGKATFCYLFSKCRFFAD